MKKIIICFLVFASGLYGSMLQAQILSAGAGTEFSIGAGTKVSADSLELTPSATYSFSNNTLSKSNTVSNSTSINYINKVYQFSATAASYSGALKLYYNNSQLNGLAASGLKLLIHNGTSWSLDNNSSTNTVSNEVMNSSVTGVSLRELTAAACSPNSATETIVACGSYIWHGTTYTANNNSATWTGTNVSGCDSVVTLNLTIAASPVFTSQPTKIGRKVALNLVSSALPAYSVSVTSNNSLSYQWYSNTVASNSGGVLIPGATTASYVPSTSSAYSAYFYCMVSIQNSSCAVASDVSEIFTVCQ